MDYLGLSFDQLDAEAVAGLLRERGADMPFAYVVTPNVCLLYTSPSPRD